MRIFAAIKSCFAAILRYYATPRLLDPFGAGTPAAIVSAMDVAVLRTMYTGARSDFEKRHGTPPPHAL